MTSPQQVSQCFGTAWTETAPDSAYVRTTCNASLKREVTGFVGSVKESNHLIIVREAPLESVSHEKRGPFNFSPAPQTQASAIPLFGGASFMQLPMTINVIGTEGLATSQCHCCLGWCSSMLKKSA
jgi:hypothetical protein